jgi:hypothetical protein
VGGHGSLPCPDQDSPPIINRDLSGVDEFGFQIVKVVVIQTELPLERPVRDPSVLLQGDHLLKHLVKGHHRPSTCASMASAWGSQNVINIRR